MHPSIGDKHTSLAVREIPEELIRKGIEGGLIEHTAGHFLHCTALSNTNCGLYTTYSYTIPTIAMWYSCISGAECTTKHPNLFLPFGEAECNCTLKQK